MNPLLVGLTGGLASGKSTVAQWLRQAGCQVLDADQIVADLHAPGAAGAQTVARLFGPAYLDSTGGVDHPKLAARVFGDAAARTELERAIHPLVRQRFAELCSPQSRIVVLEATLLVEAGYAPDFDVVVTVEADPPIRLGRAVARGMTKEAALARLEAQGDGAARRRWAHVTLINDGDLGELRGQVTNLLAALERRRVSKCLPSSS